VGRCLLLRGSRGFGLLCILRGVSAVSLGYRIRGMKRDGLRSEFAAENVKTRRNALMRLGMPLTPAI
jgi:hypothetical protein